VVSVSLERESTTSRIHSWSQIKPVSVLMLVGCSIVVRVYFTELTHILRAAGASNVAELQWPYVPLRADLHGTTFSYDCRMRLL